MYRHNNISQFEYVISFHPLITYDCNKWVIPGFPQLFPQCGAAKQGRIQSLANVAMFTLLSRGTI